MKEEDRADGRSEPEPDGLALPGEAKDRAEPDGVPDGVRDGVPDGVRDGVTGARLAEGCERGGDGLEAPAVADGRVVWSAGAVAAGLNVATDSMAPATRHTARMLASSGMTVPCPANGPARRRSRCRRRCARSSRW